MPEYNFTDAEREALIAATYMVPTIAFENFPLTPQQEATLSARQKLEGDKEDK